MLLLAVAAWLVLRAALVKLWLALPDTRLAAGLTLRLSDAEAEVDTEACADGSLTADVLSTTEAGAGALADSDGVELTDADAFALAETDVGADVDWLADSDAGAVDWPADVEALADADWLAKTDWLAEADWLTEADWLALAWASTDWLTDTEAAVADACSAWAFCTSACAWAMIELVLVSVVSAAFGSAAMTVLSFSVYSDVSSA